jgi:hypothetical protein
LGKTIFYFASSIYIFYIAIFYMNELQFILSMTEIGLGPEANHVIRWANDSIPNHYRCYSRATKRISLRLPGEPNCNLRNAFLTILLNTNGFRYLLNGEDVDMNDAQNWITGTYDNMYNESFLAPVIMNYHNR